MAKKDMQTKKSHLQTKEGTISLCFTASGDGTLLNAVSKDKELVLTLSIMQGALRLTAPSVIEGGIDLDIEDTYGILLGGNHDVSITFGDFGTRVYLDGYQCFACATNMCPAEEVGLESIESEAIHVWDLGFINYGKDSKAIAKAAVMPEPDIEFAASSLSARDISRIRHLKNGSLYARFRVRGQHQYGTIMAAGGRSECMDVYIDDDGITYTIVVDDERVRYHAAGEWTDGGWHDLVVRSFRGAIDLYIDGYLELHQPGQFFLNEISTLTAFSIGEDTSGVRLSGEVRNGGIYTYPLSDGAIKKLSVIEPLTDTALFDKGYAGSKSYRIPSIITTPSNVLIAGADQRVANSNDAPNEIHFVIRRSKDGGESWLPLQEVIAFPGKGLDGASVIDSCLVCNRDSGRVIVIIDHYPGGIGYANAEQKRGVDKDGHLILEDKEQNSYLLKEDGKVLDSEGKITPYLVDSEGYVTVKGVKRGNIYLKKGVDPQESLLTVRTSYLLEVHSDDDGETWSKPRFISHMVSEDWMGFLGISPGNGIQISKGRHAGRLLMPYYCCSDDPKFSSGGALISDDGGDTWRRGQAIQQGKVVNGKIVDEKHIVDNDAITHESVFIENSDGDVIVLFRNQNKLGLVGKSISHDGGDTWGDVTFVEGVPDVFCQPNAISLPESDKKNWRIGEGSNRVVFANASRLRPYRGCGVLRLSEDGAKTWKVSRCFNPYHYVYQCMTVLPQGGIGLLWERETAGLYFTPIPESWFSSTLG